jgi:hypothetical protein
VLEKVSQLNKEVKQRQYDEGDGGIGDKGMGDGGTGEELILQHVQHDSDTAIGSSSTSPNSVDLHDSWVLQISSGSLRIGSNRATVPRVLLLISILLLFFISSTNEEYTNGFSILGTISVLII